MLRLPRASREELLKRLGSREASPFHGLALPLLRCPLDGDLASGVLEFCGALAPGASLCLAHNDLGSGTECEQRIFELKAERERRESEKAFHQKKKSDSSKEKDFAKSAQMRREALAGIEAAEARLASIDEDLGDLEQRKANIPWYFLFSQLESQSLNTIRHLDLSNCGLHATGLVMLTNVLLELEHRAQGEQVTRLALDGNDVGDIGMTSVSSLVRLSSALEAVQLRNVGITDVGVSQVLSSLVANKTLALLDLRANGLCSLEVSKAALVGVRRFNPRVEVLLG